jgi:hypothetical protein
MKMYKEHQLVRKCLLQIEEKLGWGPAGEWHSEVFVELSETIQKETHVLLSPTTLKRVWGKVNYKSAPSISTLNVLARFAGYANWRDLKNKTETGQVRTKVATQSSNQRKLFLYAIGIAVLFISIYAAIGVKTETLSEFDFSDIEFSSRPIAKGLPNSVVFDLNLKGLESDSIYIQQYWDPTKTIKLKPNQTRATGQYYLPGYFRARLLVEGAIKKEHDLFIKSEGWLGTIDYKPIPKYFDESHILPNQNLLLSKSAISEIASNEKPLISSFHYVNDFGELSGDNFMLHTTFRNIYNDKWSVCQTTNLVVLGTKGALLIPFAIPGCVSEIGIMMNDVYLSGKENDLSGFGVDLSNFTDIAVEVKNKNVKISIKEETVFTGYYNASLGNIVGFRYRFLGAGEVASLRLLDANKKKYAFID